MSLFLEVINSLKEDAAGGAISAGDVAGSPTHGFVRGNQPLGSLPKKKKKKIIKRYINENDNIDSINALSKIKSAEKAFENNKDITGFALEDDNGQIIKVYVKSEEKDDFEKALETELSKNQDPENDHREIGEILYNLKTDFSIVNIEWPNLPTDEEEETEITPDELGVDSSDNPNGDDTKNDPNMNGEEMSPDADIGAEDGSNAKSALDAVIDMMKSDAEAKKAEANAKEKEAEAKIASLNTQAAEATVKKAEQTMDMEAYYSKKSAKEKEFKQLSKLAQYQHDLKADEVNADTNNIPGNLPQSNTDRPSMENEEQNSILSQAILSLLQDRSKRE